MCAEAAACSSERLCVVVQVQRLPVRCVCKFPGSRVRASCAAYASWKLCVDSCRYCVLTAPTGAAETPLLARFTLVPSRPDSTFSHVLCVLRTRALCVGVALID